MTEKSEYLSTYTRSRIFMLSSELKVLLLKSYYLEFEKIIQNVRNWQLGYLFFPNENMTVILLLTLPLSCMLSVEMNVIISSRASDLRTAGGLGSLILLPFGAIYVLFEINFIPFNEINLLMISAFIAVADVILFYLSKITFCREEILTKLK